MQSHVSAWQTVGISCKYAIMAGHSKFKNIMHRKGAQDKKRAKIFSRHSKAITVAVKEGGGDDISMNPRLRLAIQAAKGDNMPKDNIKRAIEAGLPGAGGADYQEVRYEGYGPGGVAVIVEALTDNRNRAAAEIRSCFTKSGGSLGETGTVSFQFEKVGEILYTAEKASAETMFEAALEAGARDVLSSEEGHEVITEMTDYGEVVAVLTDKFGDPDSSGLVWRPNLPAEVDEETAESIERLVEKLEELDDVQDVFTNMA